MRKPQPLLITRYGAYLSRKVPPPYAFFFSSRRRHPRSKRDWSSDVCSSDLTAEVLQHLRPGGGGLFVDCTIGLGGHARALLEAGATRILGLDRDLDALARARETLAPWSH